MENGWQIEKEGGTKTRSNSIFKAIKKTTMRYSTPPLSIDLSEVLQSFLHKNADKKYWKKNIGCEVDFLQTTNRSLLPASKNLQLSTDNSLQPLGFS